MKASAPLLIGLILSVTLCIEKRALDTAGRSLAGGPAILNTFHGPTGQSASFINPYAMMQANPMMAMGMGMGMYNPYMMGMGMGMYNPYMMGMYSPYMSSMYNMYNPYMMGMGMGMGMYNPYMMGMGMGMYNPYMMGMSPYGSASNQAKPTEEKKEEPAAEKKEFRSLADGSEINDKNI